MSYRTEKTAYVKDLERTVVKKDLSRKTSYEYKKSTTLKANKELAKAGNLQNIKSDCTIRKIKSESYGRLDMDKDDIIDLIKMQECHNEYVKEVAFPFNVKLYSLQQPYLASCNKAGLLYFDAAGGIIHNPFNDKRVYRYSGVIQVDAGKRLCPVFDMISAHHFAKTILKIFQDFRIFCEEHNKWPLFSGAVTDFSFANLHAITLGFNRITLSEYLHLCFNVIVLHQYPERESKFVRIHLCYSHYIKMIVRDLDKHYTEPETKSFFKGIMTVIIGLKNRFS